jgi:hypothetical protein
MSKKTIEPGEHTPEKLDDVLKYFEKSGILNPTDTRPRVARPKRTPKDPYAVAKFTVEKLRRWFEDCIVDEDMVNHAPVNGVKPAMEVVFTVELFWLNVINANNIPATPEEIQAARDAAYTYYKNNIK